MRPAAGRPDEETKQAALGLIKRLPPQDMEQNFANFLKLAPQLEHELTQHVDRPLRIARDPDENRYYVLSEYNTDGGIWRSPWSNRYFPKPVSDEVEDTLFKPSERLRRLEISFNEVFDAYKTSYYDGGVSSVYLWDLDEGFAGAFLIHKELESGYPGCEGQEEASSDPEPWGVWDSVHIVEVKEPTNTSSSGSQWIEYKLCTSVLVQVEVKEPSSSRREMEVGAHISKQAEDKRKKVGEDSHLLHIGRMIEDMECSIRQSLDVVYMAKQREVLSGVRALDTVEPYGLPCVAGAAAAQPTKATEADVSG